eukprot:1145809-Pelagomonas_calceolata.AAC.4
MKGILRTSWSVGIVPGSSRKVTRNARKGGTRHASCLGVLLGHTYHILMYAPATVKPPATL